MTTKPNRKLALWTQVDGATLTRSNPKLIARAKPRKPVRPRSKAMEAKMKIYRARVSVWIVGKECQLWGFDGNNGNPICNPAWHPATECHHKKGRGPNLMDESTWLPVCARGHGFIHNNPAKARELGLILPGWAEKERK